MTREKQQESPHIRRHLGEMSARPSPVGGSASPGRGPGTGWRTAEENIEAEKGGDPLTCRQVIREPSAGSPHARSRDALPSASPSFVRHQSKFIPSFFLLD